MKDHDLVQALETHEWLRSYLDNTEGRERLQDYVHYVAKVSFFHFFFLRDAAPSENGRTTGRIPEKRSRWLGKAKHRRGPCGDAESCGKFERLLHHVPYPDDHGLVLQKQPVYHGTPHGNPSQAWRAWCA